jgi:hypothetical protein
MSHQAAIERAAGITTPEIAAAIQNRVTKTASDAHDVLYIQCQGYDPAGFGLLKSLVDTVRAEIEAA